MWRNFADEHMKWERQGIVQVLLGLFSPEKCRDRVVRTTWLWGSEAESRPEVVSSNTGLAIRRLENSLLA